MQQRDKLFFVTVVLACVVGFGLLDFSNPPMAPAAPIVTPARIDPELPNFSGYKNVSEKKSAFFSFMLPLVEQVNRNLVSLRQKLLSLQSQAALISETQLQWLTELAEEYRVDLQGKDTEQIIAALLMRVDRVPPSLALAQSANESAWGTSRFATEGNNLFGEWCFSKGCGLVPASRADGKNHEVARFTGPAESVRSYIHNLNSNSAYREFRQLRALQRQQSSPVTGAKTASGLVNYSGRGEAYISELQAMIKVNKLGQFDAVSGYGCSGSTLEKC